MVISATGSLADGWTGGTAGVDAETGEEGDDESVADGGADDVAIGDAGEAAPGADDVSLPGAAGDAAALGVPALADGVLAFAGAGADEELDVAVFVVAAPVALVTAPVAAGAAPLFGDAAGDAVAPAVVGAEGVAAGGGFWIEAADGEFAGGAFGAGVFLGGGAGWFFFSKEGL